MTTDPTAQPNQSATGAQELPSAPRSPQVDPEPTPSLRGPQIANLDLDALAEVAQAATLTEAEVESVERAVCTLGKVECQVLGHNHARHLNRLVPLTESIVTDHLAVVEDERDEARANRDRLAHQVAALRQQVADLTAERDEARRQLDVVSTQARQIRDEREFRIRERNRAEATVAALAEAIERVHRIIPPVGPAYAAPMAGQVAWRVGYASALINVDTALAAAPTPTTDVEEATEA